MALDERLAGEFEYQPDEVEMSDLDKRVLEALPTSEDSEGSLLGCSHPSKGIAGLPVCNPVARPGPRIGGALVQRLGFSW